jgi:hypothetical protein
MLSGITMAKLKRSRRYDLACDMNWSFTYFIGRGVSRGPEDAFSNAEGGTYMAERYLQFIFSGTNTHLYPKR